MEGPLVSIIMPAYNCEKFINKAIDSILNQSFKNFELLIADDASRDRTRELIDSYQDQRIKVSHNESNLGNLQTCNKLFSLAKGEFIAIQDADDWSDSFRLEKQLDAFGKDPLLSGCCTQRYLTNVSGEIEDVSSFPLDYQQIKKGLPDSFYFHCTSIMIKKEVYQEVGGYNLYFDKKGGADWYWISLIIDKFKIINLPLPLYYYRKNPESITQSASTSSKTYTDEMIRFFINQRKSDGWDYLTVNNLSAVYEVEQTFKNDKVFLQKKYIFELLARRKYFRAFLSFMAIITYNPFIGFKFYKDIFYYIFLK
ncbi:glycosyltransferase family 2 protein [Rufibacter soli]